MIVKVDGKELDAARFLMELCNHTRSQGMGVLHDTGPVTLEQAQAEIASREAAGLGFEFDYAWGRPLKCYAHDGELGDIPQSLYDRDAGAGQFDKAVAAALRGDGS